MVKFVRETGDGASTVLTLGEAEAAHAEAQETFDDLMQERYSKRDELSRVEWREYNDSTADYQIECQDNLESTRKAVSRLLGSDVRGQVVSVGTATEQSEAGDS